MSVAVDHWSRRAVGLLICGLSAACTSHPAAHVHAVPSPSPSPSASPSVSLSPTPAAATVAPITSPPRGASPTRHSDAQPNGDGTCSSGQVQGLYAGGVEPFTGEHSAWTNLFNISKVSCTVRGYPQVEFHSSRLALPFHVRHHGMYLDGPNAGPFLQARTIPLRPGGAAHFLIAKYRCDTGEEAVVRSLSIEISGQRAWTSVALPPGYAGPGFAYCRAYNGTPDRSDPGNYMQIGPLVAGRVLGS